MLISQWLATAWSTQFNLPLKLTSTITRLQYYNITKLTKHRRFTISLLDAIIYILDDPKLFPLNFNPLIAIRCHSIKCLQHYFHLIPYSLEFSLYLGRFGTLPVIKLLYPKLLLCTQVICTVLNYNTRDVIDYIIYLQDPPLNCDHQMYKLYWMPYRYTKHNIHLASVENQAIFYIMEAIKNEDYQVVEHYLPTVTKITTTDAKTIILALLYNVTVAAELLLSQKQYGLFNLVMKKGYKQSLIKTWLSNVDEMQIYLAKKYNFKFEIIPRCQSDVELAIKHNCKLNIVDIQYQDQRLVDYIIGRNEYLRQTTAYGAIRAYQNGYDTYDIVASLEEPYFSQALQICNYAGETAFYKVLKTREQLLTTLQYATAQNTITQLNYDTIIRTYLRQGKTDMVAILLAPNNILSVKLDCYLSDETVKWLIDNNIKCDVNRDICRSNLRRLQGQLTELTSIEDYMHNDNGAGLEFLITNKMLDGFPERNFGDYINRCMFTCVIRMNNKCLRVLLKYYPQHAKSSLFEHALDKLDIITLGLLLNTGIKLPTGYIFMMPKNRDVNDMAAYYNVIQGVQQSQCVIL